MLSVCSARACCGWSKYTLASVRPNQPAVPLPLPSTWTFSVNRPAYRPEAATDGWQKIWDFYGRYLAG